MRSTRNLLLGAVALFVALPLVSQEVAPAEIPTWQAPPYWSPGSKTARVAREPGTLGEDAVEIVPTPPLPFIGINPCRIVDTRGNGFFAQAGPPTLSAGAGRTFQIAGLVAGLPAQCGIPPTAQAVSLQFTIIGPNSAGNLIAWPGGPIPSTSVVNYESGIFSIGNGSVVALGGAGEINVFLNAPAGASAQLTIDVNGYYDNTGLITGITAGVGLFGGGTSGNVTLGLTFGGSGTASSASHSDHTHGTGEIVSGFLADARLGGTYSNALTLSNPSNSFTGNGSGLTDLNASNLASGTVPNARISGTYSGAVSLTNPANVLSGDGSGIFNVNGAQRPQFGTFTLDGAGDIASLTSATIGVDGLGLILFRNENTSTLNVAHCSNTACSAATVEPVGVFGVSGSLTIGSDGLGLISSMAQADGGGNVLKSARCVDVACSDFTVATLSGSGSPYDTSIAVGTDGLALIAYYESPYTGGDLKVAHCSNPACTSATFSTLDSDGNVGLNPSLTIGADGLGLISYGDLSTEGIKVAHCSNVPCTAATITPLDTNASSTSITIGADGLGLISYRDSSADDLKVAHCSNVLCTTATITPIDDSGGQGSSITTGNDGLGVIAYVNASADLKVAHCSNATCSMATLATVDSTSNFGGGLSVTIGTDGFPLISYRDATNGDLRVAHCSNALCTPFVRRR